MGKDNSEYSFESIGYGIDDTSSNLVEAVCISLRNNTLQKGINLNFLSSPPHPPAMDKC